MDWRTTFPSINRVHSAFAHHNTRITHINRQGSSRPLTQEFTHFLCKFFQIINSIREFFLQKSKVQENIGMAEGSSSVIAKTITSSMDQLSPEMANAVQSLSGLSIFVNTFCLPVSALNFMMIAQTALLHRNLKFLLLLQSIFVCLFSISEIVRMMPKLVHHDQFYQWTEWNMKSTLIVMILLDWLGFALLSERILATIKCRTYENDQSRWFCITAGIFLTLATIVCYASTVDLKTSNGVATNNSFFLYEIYSFLVTSFLCMLVVFYILKYNKQRYAKLAFVRGVNRDQDLSFKYQLSENIRTSWQLLPSGFFHFIDVFLTIGISLLSYYGIFSNDLGWNTISRSSIFIFYGFSNVGMQISVIIMHPMLNRRLRRMIAPVFMAKLWKRRIGHMGENGHNQGTRGTDENGQRLPLKRCEMPLNIYGDDLLRQNANMGEYFKVLETFWK